MSKKNEQFGLDDTKVGSVLGVKVDLVSREQTLRLIEAWLGNRNKKQEIRYKKFKLKHIVTAYSEFFVRSQKYIEFKKALDEADLIVPDGVSVLAAIRFQRLMLGKGGPHQVEISSFDKAQDRQCLRTVRDDKSDFRSLSLLSILLTIKRLWFEVVSFWYGLQVGWEILTGRLGETVTGVWLTEQILRLAPEKGWKVFLLGGYGETAENKY